MLDDIRGLAFKFQISKMVHRRTECFHSHSTDRRYDPGPRHKQRFRVVFSLHVSSAMGALGIAKKKNATKTMTLTTSASKGEDDQEEYTFVVVPPSSSSSNNEKNKNNDDDVKDVVATCRKIRTEVFIDEQDIPPDIEYDGKDHLAYHVLCYSSSRSSVSSEGGYIEDEEEEPKPVPVGTGRLMIVDDDEEIGDDTLAIKKRGILARIAIHKEYRGKGLGSQIVRQLESIALCVHRDHHNLKMTTLSLTPHLHLEKFYGKLGYETIPGSNFFAGKHELIKMKKDL